MINVFEPQLKESDISAVNEVLRSKWIGRGVVTKQLTLDLAKTFHVNDNQITITNSCTQAAFILAEYLKSKGYSQVFLPSMSFVGIANAFLSNNFKINFIDVASTSGNAEIQNIEGLQIPNNSILILNQYCNGSETTLEIAEFCRSREIILIEDAAGAFGGQLEGKTFGTFGDFGIWSLDAMKTISAGDGGIIYSKDPNISMELAERIYLGLKSESGISKSSDHFDKWWEFDISGPFSRSITNDILAALAVSQLSRIEEKLEIRSSLVSGYKENLSGLSDLGFFTENKLVTRSSSYLMPVMIRDKRDQLAKYLLENEIYTTFRYFPLHTLSIFSSNSYLPETMKLSNEILLLPLHEGLTHENIEYISERVREFLD